MSLSTGKGGYLPKVVGTPQQMENETLLEGLQNILDDYPDGSQILREMVQNAEDAGATCMKIMYDSRPIDPGKSLNISKYFKGPGICIYNDETFKDIDWRGIKKIGASFKRKLNEPLKVGRFGQGFKSVFHIADHAVILSGTKLLIIDPLKSEEKEDDCWSASLKDLSGDDSPQKTLTCFDGKFGFNSKIIFEEEPEYKGTLFWIPLREKSSLTSPKVYTNENIDQLFESFKREAPIIPLFLRHIKHLELSFVKTDRFSYCIELVEENILEGNKEYEKVIREIEQRKSLPDTTIASVREVVVRTYPHAREDFTKDHWTIVQYLYGSAQMSQSMKLLSRDKGLSLSPCTGIAFCTKSNSVNKPSGHVFCFLPLPLSDRSITGLPVHVNGFFALEHNRCHVKFGCDQDQSDNSLLWNDGLIAEFLPQNYNHIICHFKELCKKGGNTPDLVETFYKLIPDPDSVDQQWHPLLKSLYDTLLKKTSFIQVRMVVNGYK